MLPEHFPLMSLKSIQSVALSAFHVCFAWYCLEAQWIPGSLNGKADLLRRFFDKDDSPVNPCVSSR